MKLREKILEEIRTRGPLAFSRYMDLCLHEPELGYYSRHAGQFGKAGDFYTASDVHAVFGRLLARQFEEMWRALGSPAPIEILELGPGRGLFAQDVLAWSRKKFPAFFAALHYSLLEQSPALQERLRQTLAEHFASGKASFSGLARRSAPLIIFANEFFDAFPVDVLSAEGKLYVGEQGGNFVESWAPAAAAELEYLDRYGIHPEGKQRVEVALPAQRMMEEVAAAISTGFVLAIDYGYTRAEQLAGRYLDTLVTYRRHSAGSNPYEAPGEQDITAHVNFTALAAAAEDAGLHLQKLLTQSQFLMGIGEANQFADAFEECRLPQEQAKVALQLKHLVTPSGMGESFQVLMGSKGVPTETVEGLSGLSFAKSRLQAG
ncbi:MAG: SAM-dependent methyltransferase [Acidobacteria bacterium]|nr:SAM-dependent methyltransferase [Acidobacteriota bacterium]